jgi:NADH-quinone oxidoreductase subunit F
MHFLAGPEEVVLKDGKLHGVHFRKMALGSFDRSGRRSPVPMAKGAYTLPADQVIVAVGQTLRPETLFDGVTLKLNDRDAVMSDPMTGRTSEPWIFAGGDMASGPASVVEAVAAGERAAVAMDRFLTGAEHAVWRIEKKVDTFFDPDVDPVEMPRAVAKLLSPARRKQGFEEVEAAWSRPVALAQAKRCLRCDYREEC